MPLLAVSLVLVAVVLGVDDEWTNTSTPGVQDLKSNPILRPTELGEWILGDPTVVQIGSTLHLWANEIFHGIQHYTAPVGSPFEFTHLETSVMWPGADRAYAYFDESTKTVVLYYEQYEPPLFNTAKLFWRESTAAGPAGGKWEWSKATLALEPTLPWEMVGTKRIGNPFVFFNEATKKWRLYYSASSIHLPDASIDEPLHFGLAEADFLRGPWTRASSEPVVIAAGLPIPGIEFIGAGTLKLTKGSNGKIQALCNRITRTTATNQTGSTISSLAAADPSGLRWQVMIPAFIAPTAADGWKHSYVYAFDTIADPIDPRYMLVYYNARNWWKNGTEAIGASRVLVAD